jgi:hypothetical protein
MARLSCLEVLPVAWALSPGETHSEYAHLIEISKDDGLFHVDEPAVEGTRIRISLPHGEVGGTVRSCTREPQYGYLLEVDVHRRQDWLGGRYTPAYLVSPADRNLAKAS